MGVHFDLTADVDQFETALNKGERALVRVERAGDKVTTSTKRVGAESKKSSQLLQALKEAAEGVGGTTGENAGRIEKFAKAIGGVGGALGPAGLALGGVVAGTAAFGVAALTAALNTNKLVKELEAAGRASPLDPGEAAVVSELDREMAKLTLDVKAAAAEFGARFAPALLAVIGHAQSAATAIAKVKDAVRDVTIFALGLGPVVEQWRRMREEAEKAALQQEQYRGFLLGFSWQQGRKNVEQIVKRMEWLAGAEKRAAENAAARERALAQLATAQASLDQIYQSGADALLSKEQFIRVAYQRRIDEINRLERETGDAHTAEVARANEKALLVQKLADIKKKAAQEELASLREMRDAEEERQKKAEQDAREKAEVERHGYMQTLAAIETVGRVFARTSQDMTEEARKRALISFRISQAAAVAQITVDTAAAIMRAFREYGPTPAGYASAIGMGAAGASQAAVVLSEPAPAQFDQGGVVRGNRSAPDHFPVMASDGEGFLNQSGVANVGGADGIRAINQGRSGGMREVAFVRIRHRWFDAAAREHLERDGPFARAIRDAMGPIGHRVVYG